MDKLETLAPYLVGKFKIDDKGCWIWQAAHNNQGYATVSTTRKYKTVRALAHRVSYAAFYGSIPGNKDLDHLCKVTNCINPKHLEPVSHRENVVERGVTNACAVNARKTHCKNGHEYTPENTFNRQRPGRAPERECLICRKNQHIKNNQKYRAKKKAERKVLGLNWQGKPYKKLAYLNK